MARELNEEDYKAFKEFEEKIMSIKSPGIRYQKDFEMDAQIKKEILFEKFGSKKTDEALEKLKLNYLDLSDQEIYVEIYRFLDTIN